MVLNCLLTRTYALVADFVAFTRLQSTPFSFGLLGFQGNVDLVSFSQFRCLKRGQLRLGSRGSHNGDKFFVSNQKTFLLLYFIY